MAPRTDPIIHLRELSPLLVTCLAVVIVLLPGVDSGQIVGMIASVVAFAVFIPQALRVWRMRDDHHALMGVSIVSSVFVVNNALVWFLYAAVVGEFWVGAAGFVSLPLASVIIGCIIRSRWVQRHDGAQHSRERM